MDEEACKRFFSLDKAGRRKESKLAFRQFADSFQSTNQRDKWVLHSMLHKDWVNKTMKCKSKTSIFPDKPITALIQFHIFTQNLVTN